MAYESTTADRRHDWPEHGDGNPPERFETVIVGGGQAGLAVGCHLARRERPFVILEANERIGDQWRRQWDSMRLYSPARYDALPGMSFPAPAWSFPTKDEVADYLSAYARELELPVRTGVGVDRLTWQDGRYVIAAGERRLEADNVVVATGNFARPYRPDFADELDPGIVQLHSSEYRNPSQLQDGPVLVVGAAHSGADVAFEVSGEHETVLSGRDTGAVPFKIDGRPARIAIWHVFQFVAKNVLTLRTPIGRKMRSKIRLHGGPLLRHKAPELAAAGVERVHERTVGARDGRPVLEDGRVLDVANVVWCTGFHRDNNWIDLPVVGDDGWPYEDRGVVPDWPGLYFAGLLFLSSFSSMLILGAGKDGAHIAKQIDAAARDGRTAARPRATA